MSRDPRPALSSFGLAGLLFLVAWLAFVANCRTVGTVDSLATSLGPFALWRGDGFVLDGVVDASLRDQYAFTEGLDGRLRNAYPVGGGLVVAPLYAPLALLPDFAAERLPLGWVARVAEKYAAATVASLAVVVLFDLLLLFTDRWRAAALALVFALATPVWAVASQSLFQHGPAVLVFLLALRLLCARSPTAAGSALAGALAALVVATRLPDGLLAAALGLVALRRPHRVPFVVAALAGLAAFAVYNLTTFGSLAGGYAAWTIPPASFSGATLAGLLVGNRGLLFFSPYLVLFDFSRRPGDPLDAVDRWLLAAAAVGTLLYFAGFGVWWGGENYGARYLVDLLPLLFVLGAHSFERPLRSPRIALLATGVVVALAIQAIGAFRFPGGASELASNLEPQLLGLRRSTAFLALEAGPMPPQLAPLALLGAQRPLPSGARAEVELLASPPLRWPARGRYPIWFRVTNASASPFPAWGSFGGALAVQPVIYWRRVETGVWTVAEFALGEDLAPGAWRDFERQMLAPEATGAYELTVLLVERGDDYRLLGSSKTVRVTVGAADSRPWTPPPGAVLSLGDFESGDASQWDALVEEPSADGRGPEDPKP